MIVALKSFVDLNYILAAESATVESATVESATTESAAAESAATESVVASAGLLELQATTDKEIANAKNPNFNKFFMLISFLNND